MTIRSEYVEYAFSAIQVLSIEEYIQEVIEAFAQRWGDLNLTTFAYVLHHAHGEDQMIAALAIGHTRSAWEKAFLLPFLQSDDPGVRWAAALSLGEIKEERARPAQVQMLQEFLPPPYTPLGEVGPDWFEVKHLHVADLLGRWGDPALIPALWETLARVWQVERDAPAHEDPQMWWHYEDELAYALGQLGAFDAPTFLEVPVPRRRVWTVNTALGYLNTKAHYKKSCLGLIGDMADLGRYQELSTLLLQVLQENADLSLQEANSYLQQYSGDYFGQWGDGLREIQQQAKQVPSESHDT